jgi:hypothetical protein
MNATDTAPRRQHLSRAVIVPIRGHDLTPVLFVSAWVYTYVDEITSSRAFRWATFVGRVAGHAATSVRPQ